MNTLTNKFSFVVELRSWPVVTRHHPVSILVDASMPGYRFRVAGRHDLFLVGGSDHPQVLPFPHEMLRVIDEDKRLPEVASLAFGCCRRRPHAHCIIFALAEG